MLDKSCPRGLFAPFQRTTICMKMGCQACMTKLKIKLCYPHQTTCTNTEEEVNRGTTQYLAKRVKTVTQ